MPGHAPPPTTRLAFYHSWPFSRESKQDLLDNTWKEQRGTLGTEQIKESDPFLSTAYMLYSWPTVSKKNQLSVELSVVCSLPSYPGQPESGHGVIDIDNWWIQHGLLNDTSPSTIVDKFWSGIFNWSGSLLAISWPSSDQLVRRYKHAE